MDRPRKKFPPFSFALFGAGIAVAVMVYFFKLAWPLAVLVTASVISMIFSTVIVFRQHRFLKKAGTLLDGVRQFEQEVDKKITKIAETSPIASQSVIDLPPDLIERLEELDSKVQTLEEKGVVITPSIETPEELEEDPAVEPVEVSRVDEISKVEDLSHLSDEDRLEAAVREISEISNVIPLTKRENRKPAFADRASTPENDQLEPAREEKPAKVETKTVTDKIPDIGEMELLLQPIVSLTDKSIHHYEAYAKEPGDSEQVVIADPRGQFEFGEQKSKVAEFDLMMLDKIIDLQKQLKKDKINAEIFWNFCPLTLCDENIASQIFNMFKSNKGIAEKIHPEISQSAFNKLTAAERQKLEQLCKLGIRLSLDQCSSKNTVKSAMDTGMFDYFKLQVETMLDYENEETDVFGEEIVSMVSKSKAEIIVTRVETDEQILNILDYDIAYGQGNLFSPPLPAKIKYQSEKVADTGT